VDSDTHLLKTEPFGSLSSTQHHFKTKAVQKGYVIVQKEGLLPLKSSRV